MQYGLEYLLWTHRLHDGIVPVVARVHAIGQRVGTRTPTDECTRSVDAAAVMKPHVDRHWRPSP